MSTLNCPTNPSVGDIYQIDQNTWVWDGYAWIKYSSSAQSPISINTGTASTSTNTGALVIDGGVGVSGSLNIGNTSTIAGAEIITTATWANFINLQTVTDSGNSTTNVIHILNTTESTGTGTGALIVDGGISAAKRIHCESLQIADAIMDSSKILVNNTATVVVDAYAIGEFRSAKYLIQIEEQPLAPGDFADFQVIEIILLVNNEGDVFATEYGIVSSNGEMGEFLSDMQLDNIIRLYFRPFYASDKTLKVFRTAMSV